MVMDDCNVFAASVQFHVWHKRLGHMARSKMSIVYEYAKFQSNNNKQLECEVCPKAKQHRIPFPTSHNSSTCILSFYMLMYGDLIAQRLM